MGALAFELEAAAERQQPRLFAVPGGATTEAPTAREATRPSGRGSGSPAAREVEAPLMPTTLGGPAVAAPVRTLDAVVGEVFATVGAGRQTSCLLCGGAVRPRPTASGAATAARCGDCGTSYGS